MFFGLFGGGDDSKTSESYELENVTINKDGIVKLDLSKESVRKKVQNEANKFSKLEEKLSSF
ncbi:MAG: hypothetical protein Alis3KO_26390 [Aliiglaciecola sp.]